MHLSLLPSPPPPEPLLHEQATQGHAGDNDQGVIDTEKDKASPERSDASSPEDGGFDDDAEIDELLRALSESSSSEDDKDDDVERPRLKPEGRRRKLNPFGSHGPANNIALLVVACWTLRLPIMYMDLIRFGCHILCSLAGFSAEPVFRSIESYNLPYLEPLHHLPQSMTRHLTKHNVQALSPAVRNSCYSHE